MSGPEQHLGRGVPQWLRLLLAVLLWVLVASASISATGTEGAAASIVAGVACAGALGALARLLPPAVSFGPLRAASVLRSWVVFAPCWVALLLAYLWAMHTAGHAVAPQEALVVIASGSPSMRFGMALTAVVSAPVLEEILFRGYLQSALASWLGARVAWLATAVVFGVAHGLAYAIPLAGVGLWLGWLRQRHGALLVPMLGHALHNGLMVLITLLWPESVELLYPR